MSTFIGISRDHSGSMTSLKESAMKDYNSCISSIKDSCLREGQDAYVSVVKFGVGVSGIELDTLHTNIKDIRPINYYETKGMTPLFDSVGELIELLEIHYGLSHNFLIMVITDGYENQSRKWNASKLTQKIKELQATDRWTFTFRVPKGNKRALVALGIPDGNILEWEQTSEGLDVSSRITTQAVSNYFTNVSKDITSSRSFYTDLSGVTTSEIKAILDDVSDKVKLFHVKPSDPLVIKPFMEKKTGSYDAGSVYYQLTKTESRVQEHKNIVVRDSKKGKYYNNARGLLGLPQYGTVRVVPKDHGKFDIFIQSTSYNRKLVEGTTVLVLE